MSTSPPGLSLALKVPGIDQLADLPFAHPPHGGHVERLAGVDQFVAEGDDLCAEGAVAGDRPQFDQRLPFVGPGRPLRSEIAAERLERNGQASRAAEGAQPQVDFENPLAVRADRVRHAFHELDVKFGRG